MAGLNRAMDAKAKSTDARISNMNKAKSTGATVDVITHKGDGHGGMDRITNKKASTQKYTKEENTEARKEYNAMKKAKKAKKIASTIKMTQMCITKLTACAAANSAHTVEAAKCKTYDARRFDKNLTSVQNKEATAAYNVMKCSTLAETFQTTTEECQDLKTKCSKLDI